MFKLIQKSRRPDERYERDEQKQEGQQQSSSGQQQPQQCKRQDRRQDQRQQQQGQQGGQQEAGEHQSASNNGGQQPQAQPKAQPKQSVADILKNLDAAPQSLQGRKTDWEPDERLNCYLRHERQPVSLGDGMKYDIVYKPTQIALELIDVSLRGEVVAVKEKEGKSPFAPGEDPLETSYNPCAAPSTFEPTPENMKGYKIRRVGVELAHLLEALSEDLAWYPMEGDDEWDVDAIMSRRMDKRPLHKCRQSRTKESIVLIIDTSPSCYEYSQLFSQVCVYAIEAGHVDVYIAPNAYISQRWDRNTRKWIDLEPSHSRDYSWRHFFRNRHAIFFGDADGLCHIVRSSYENTLWWFCSEERVDMWCSEYQGMLGAFRGDIYKCTNLDDFEAIVKRLRA